VSIDKLLHSLTKSLKEEMPATGEAARSFAEALRRAYDDPREQQRISDIADLLEAEEVLYADALSALGRGDLRTALPLLQQCAQAGTGEADWLLAQLLEDLGRPGEAIIWYQRAADDGDGRATDKLTELRTPDIAGLVRGAVAGDRRAWELLVDQYSRLIWSITADFKLAESDAADVVQTTWLRLLEHIDRIEDPDRVGSWLAATARNECLRSLAARKRVVLARDEEVLTDLVASGPGVDERILAHEREMVVRDALTRLPRRWQRLLELLMADQPVSYAEISDELGLPDSISPAYGRCLARIRGVLRGSEADNDSARQTSLSPQDWEMAGELVRCR
jgi:RNA polymerase sigma factor (sigma-70 family)